MNVVIDGNFIEKTVQNGAQRYAIEVLKELDNIVCADNGYSIVVREDKAPYISLKNIKIVLIKCDGSFSWKYKIWCYVIKNRALYVSFNNRITLSKQSIITIHDVYEYYGMHNRSAFYYIKNRAKTREVTWLSNTIVTVSDFSRDAISQKLGINEERIEVIPNAWQHLEKTKIDNNVTKRFGLVAKDYYLFIGRLVANKNIDWIFREADYPENKEETFVIAGGLSKEKFDFYKGKNNNIVYTGYISDEEIAGLYSNCKAFLFPSLMEGFGIPPMEALFFGAPIIVSNYRPLPEIYGGSAHYIDPHKYNYKLSELLKEPVDDPEKTLDKYSWRKSAEKWYSLIEKCRKM